MNQLDPLDQLLALHDVRERRLRRQADEAARAFAAAKEEAHRAARHRDRLIREQEASREKALEADVAEVADVLAGMAYAAKVGALAADAGQSCERLEEACRDAGRASGLAARASARQSYRLSMMNDVNNRRRASLQGARERQEDQRCDDETVCGIVRAGTRRRQGAR